MRDSRTCDVRLVGLLTLATGCVDVVSLSALGGAVTSVVTGNLVFVGRGIGSSTFAGAAHIVIGVAG
jgi:uncharacterized membrane protein YoaK (UPF0700 family)